MSSRIQSLDPLSSACASQKGGSLTRRLLDRLLPAIEAGRLHITLPSGEVIDHCGAAAGADGTITLDRWRTLWRLMSAGDLGFAQAYADADWHTPDLPALLECGMRNETALADKANGLSWVHALNRLRHRKRANTRRGSRRNIIAHYDLGNAFYSQWLDASMNYSSALYGGDDQTLEDAQLAKLNCVAGLLDLQGGERILEIGCGWGALAEHLMSKHGASVTGLTLSAEQMHFARKRLAAYPQGDADILLQDYRDVEVSFDRVVSIEMLEAVGEDYWPAYFNKVRHCLNEGGLAVLQVITIDESRFDAYRARPDFIQCNIFPGGMLPTKNIVRAQAERAGLTLVEEQFFGDSYARTLREWRARFLIARPNIQALGFDERFARLWEYYLAYCEVGFRLGAVDVGLFKFSIS